MTRYSHAGAANPTALTAGINAADTTFSVSDATGWPLGSTPFVVVLDRGTSSEEKLTATRSSNVFSVVARGFDQTAAISHGPGAAVEHAFSAKEADEANAHVNQVGPGDDPHPQYLTQTEADVLYAAVGDTSGSSSAPQVFDITHVDFGAVGDNSTDCKTALQNAINAAVAAGGGVVVIPAGIFRISGIVYIEGDNITIRGEGATSVLRTTSGTQHMLYVNGSVTARYNVRIEGLAFDATAARTGGAAVVFDTVHGCRLLDTTMNGMYQGLAVVGLTTSVVWVDRGYWTNFTAVNGIALSIEGGNDHYISNLVIDNTPGSEPLAGVRFRQTEGSWMRDVSVVHCRYGLLIDPGASQFVRYLFATSCAFDFSTNIGMEITSPTTTSNVENLSFTGCWSSSNTSVGTHLKATGGGTLSGVTLVGHRAFVNGSHGLLIETCKDVEINGGQFSGNSSPARGATSGTASGIAVTTATGVRIIGVRSGTIGTKGTSQSYGVDISSAAADNFIVANNDMRDNVTGGLRNLAGTGATRLVANNLP